MDYQSKMYYKRCEKTNCCGVYIHRNFSDICTNTYYCTVCNHQKQPTQESFNRVIGVGEKKDFLGTKCPQIKCPGTFSDEKLYDQNVYCNFCGSSTKRYAITVNKIHQPQAAAGTQSNLNYNYQAPVQTNLNTWSVFVRKFVHNQCVSVIEHKFADRESADIFSKNNWNLGEYF